MLLLRHLARIGGRFNAPVLTLGSFDGVHHGHQQILRRLVEVARSINGQAIVLTFYPHPATVLAPEHVPKLITDWRARMELIAAFDVGAIIMQHFTRSFSQITAENFVRRFLVEGLGVRAVVVGHRVSFGHNRAGHATTLRQLGMKYGFAVEVIGPVEVEGHLVSSSAVRRAISHGELQRAKLLLGRTPSVAGRVAHGHHRGKGLGFPTANLRIGRLVLPPDGVYAVRVRVRGEWRPGIANLGFNPTFHQHERSLEAHIFDYHAELYGDRVEIAFVQRLRGEQEFSTPQALARQIARDVEAARQALARSE
ncbi:MAG: bifunctional riboflavin kinase/FAD synthetase [Candidatus Binatia bacterium]|jgi:riboflavin kinase / FMN adenylyltransferase